MSIEKKKRCRSMKKGSDSIPAFLLKTYDILENAIYSDIIGWNEEGTAFIVKKVNEFSELVLPKSFKHNNFASFVRQLNMYDFHKTRHDNNENEFKHKLFRRGQRNLLQQIKRKTNDQMQPNSLSIVKSDVMINGQPEVTDLSTQMAVLSNKQTELEKLIKIIIKQNEKFQKENKYLWNELMKNKQKNEAQQDRLLMWFLQSLAAPKATKQKYNSNNQMLMLKQNVDEGQIDSKRLKSMFSGEEKSTLLNQNLEATLEGLSKQQLLQGLLHALNCSSGLEKKAKRKNSEEDDIFDEHEFEAPEKKVKCEQLMLYNEPQYKQASDQQAREEDNFIITDYPDFLSRKSSYFDPEYGHQQFFEE